jgi:hypothetical protein
VKLFPLLSIFTAALAAGAFAQVPSTGYVYDHAVPLPGQADPAYTSTTTGIGTTSKSASGAAPSSTPDERNVDGDDSLYRGRTSESENPMLRDEGPIHFKPQAKEKIQQVDSLKSLQSQATDHTFDGNLLHSSVTSIQDVIPKADEEKQAVSQANSRFQSKQLTFTRDSSEQAKKSESESTPSPTPSATASRQNRDRTNP